MKPACLAISILLLFSGLTACSQSPTHTTASDTPSSDGTIYVRLPPNDFEIKRSELANEQLIDVRTPAEYQGGHLSEATLMDFRGERFEQDLDRLDRDRPVMLYCAKGGRSTGAAARLQAMGFREIYELDGGLTGWLDAGKAVTP